jgi:hypothetical protein
VIIIAHKHNLLIFFDKFADLPGYQFLLISLEYTFERLQFNSPHLLSNFHLELHLLFARPILDVCDRNLIGFKQVLHFVDRMRFIEAVLLQLEVNKFNWACKFVNHQVPITHVEAIHLMQTKH